MVHPVARVLEFAVLRLVGALLLAGSLVALAPSVASADTVEVSNFAEVTEDPRSVTFTARVVAPAGVESARFIYTVVNPDGNVGGNGAATFSPGSEIDLSFSLSTITADRYIPVGSTFRYRWEVTDTEGDAITTDEREFLFLDGRYNWQSRTQDEVTVFWYGDNDDRATQALQATVTSLERVEGLLQTDVPYPIKVVVYASEQDGVLARQPRGATFDSMVSTGGQRVAPDLVFVFVPSDGIVLHEVGHIVTHVAGDGPFTSIPSWLDEGTAVWAQGSPGFGYSSALEMAIRGDATLTLRAMQSASNRPEEVNLFYGQSYSTVQFLIDEYGPEAFAELYRVHREGTRIDQALEEVYGLNQDGLYNAWRESVGLEPIDFGSGASPTQAPGAQATRAPLGIPTSVPGPSGQGSAQQPASTPTSGGGSQSTGDSGSDSNATVAIAVGGVAVLLALGLGAGGLMLLRRR